MNVDVEPRQSRWSRLLLLAGGVGLAWCAFTTFGHSASASATEDDSSGLLGAVSSTVQQTTSAVTNVIDTVEPVVVDVIHTVVPPAPAPAPASQAPAAAAPAPGAAPAPTVMPLVTPLVQGVANVATTAVSGVTGATTSALHGTADTVDALTGVVADTTTGIVSNVSIGEALDPLLAAIDGLPLLGAVTTGTGLTDTVGSTVSVVDHLLTVVSGTATTIVGNPAQSGTGGILPLPDTLLPGDETQPIPVVQPVASAAPLTAQQALVFGGFFAGALIVGSAVPIVSASSTGSGRWGWPHAPSAPSGSPGLLSAGVSAAATLWAALVEFSWRVHPHGGAIRSLSDDALPGAPVFATDVSPD
ncbi:hypothetical protein [Microbacterium lacus]|uniref:hypothetical protein n=1 Tax=Microbacterium lacus TaxID=415217 RepID=UPI000C2C46AE|nr:hypothetical protein [Microbacterium lacus]